MYPMYDQIGVKYLSVTNACFYSSVYQAVSDFGSIKLLQIKKITLKVNSNSCKVAYNDPLDSKKNNLYTIYKYYHERWLLYK